MSELPLGIYERLLDEELKTLLDSQPELKPVLRGIDDESSPHAYSQFIGRLVHQALRVAKKEERIPILNRLIELLSATDGLDFLARKKLLSEDKNLLTEIGGLKSGFTRPETPLSTSTLLTGLGLDPPLEHELRAEMLTADSLDILVSFIKWSGLRLLMPAFEELRERNVPVRIISTSYMGASDPHALEWLAKQPNIKVRVSYDTGGTRLHAKAYHFVRKTGYSTAYIGSANMSHSAMTDGLEWTVKVTAQDMPHILSRFIAEFSTYWENQDFEPFEESQFGRFRQAINNYRNRVSEVPQFFADITPRPFQSRILEALEATREMGNRRNLVVAATGTGKTVISALDYKHQVDAAGTKSRLLFVVHRKEILEQALACFRTVLRDQNFGELLVDGMEPNNWNHVFASIQSLNRKQPWQSLGEDYYKFVIVDEAHHGKASSYRPLFDHLEPEILLGLTATPERMDGSSILPDFGDRFAAEIRLPEALEEKLLCPFHYFGVADSVNLEEERFWRNGHYDISELESVYTGDDFRAKERIDVIIQALSRYQPDLSNTRAVGFCASVRHAKYMSEHFNRAGIKSATLTGETHRDVRRERLLDFREGNLKFLFTVDVLSEGVDVPEINLVMFLRPTESLTVFLQQLGRGLRHASGKDCLTVLDFVGQTHRKYRLDTKFTALLSRHRKRIDREIENDFPNLPPGCSIHLERVARERVLNKIRSVLNDLNHFIPETIQTWSHNSDKPLTFGNFIEETGLSPIEVLGKKTWTQWKRMSEGLPAPDDPDLKQAAKSLPRIALRTDPDILQSFEDLEDDRMVSEPHAAYHTKKATALHYLMWGKKASAANINTANESFKKWMQNSTVAEDAAEIARWRRSIQNYPIRNINLPFNCQLKLHAAYGSAEIKAALGLATLHKPGPTGLGVLHAKELKCYVHLVTFRKDEKDFSPTTLYRDYPISRTVVHWESQSTASQESPTGQNYIHFKERGYTILFFARIEKRYQGETMPFTFLGPAKGLNSFDGNRPIQMTWELEHPMPAALFEEARPV
jgi:superfamily II DNA or RNA helicase